VTRIYHILAGLGGAIFGLGVGGFLMTLWTWHSVKVEVNYASVACQLLLAIGLMVLGSGITLVNQYLNE